MVATPHSLHGDRPSWVNKLDLKMRIVTFVAGFFVLPLGLPRDLFCVGSSSG